MTRISVFTVTALTAVITLGGCGSTPTAAVHYSSARQLIAALRKGGLTCTGVTYNRDPAVSGASSEAICYRDSGQTQIQVDVFPGKITLTQVLNDSQSTTTAIWNDYGPDWDIQTTRRYANRASAIVGGTITAGPVQAPPPPSAAPAGSGSATSAECLQHAITWRDKGAGTDLAALASAMEQVGNATSAAASSGDSSASMSVLSTAAAKLLAAAQVAQAQVPPACLPGLRSDWAKLASDAAQAAQSTQNSVAADQDGDLQTATADMQAATSFMVAGTRAAQSATRILKRLYAGG